MIQFDAKVLSNDAVAPRWRRLELGWPADQDPLPGQFLTLRPGRASDPLLRRPFAFASRDEAGGGALAVSILYEERGLGTALIAALRAGDEVDALGPLGKGFPGPREGEEPILLAGGVGLGPVLFLAAELARAARAASPAAGLRPPLFLAGFRTKAAIPAIAFPEGALICTDDGSAGFHGTPLDWVSHNAPAASGPGIGASARPRVYACGPAPMLAAAARLSRARGWEASLSAEAWMACGVGACMGCALPRPDAAGYLRACHDGPVFGRDEIDWEAIR